VSGRFLLRRIIDDAAGRPDKPLAPRAYPRNLGTREIEERAMKQTSLWDTRGLIADALAMEGLSVEENRAIFFDWAFGLAEPERAAEAARDLLTLHRTAENADHAMIALLEDAANGAAAGRGRTGRRRPAEA